MKIHRLLSSLQNGLTKRSSSWPIWFQMRCWMTSCLNHDYLILIFIHFPYLLYENPSFIIVSVETEYFSTRSWYRNIHFIPWVCRRPAETVFLQRKQICYRWGTPAYWSLVPRGSMYYLFEFWLKNMWNCSLIQQIWSHRFYDWKLCEWFLFSGFLICHAVGWYTELTNQKFWWRIPESKILIEGYPKDM
jgi:hypothetical protein